ncbi:hypothetical protein [Sphingomonas sp. SUN039]|uniref:hypothetical protein n=1 Tax=Sphingomonas sp. SUN039 TaxID=2937787 RepID=UPI002164605E|nr:hypothetical protein [Sphingomonas sp. SUN039]UVO54377.1 hypothetical protein M0209_09685 [Sphingomonas sp. SUN039]
MTRSTAWIGMMAFEGAALLAGASTPPDRWWSPGEGRVFPAALSYANPDGVLGLVLDGGPMATKGHPFFEPRVPGGRACVTCHQPADAMGLSVASARERWDATGGKDPLFLGYDGSNCPTLPQGDRASHSLLLDYGLIRIERPWPVKGADFQIEVVRDPNGCNSGQYGPAKGKLSVYRRPRPVANIKYLEAMGFAYDPKAGMPLPLDPDTHKPAAGNFMADRRVLSLEAQLHDADITHLQFAKRMDAADVAKIVDFERRIFTAQRRVGTYALNEAGAAGGPETLQRETPGKLGSIGNAVWSEYAAWEKMSDADKAKLDPQELAFRQSVARGARSFRERTFLITDSAGINAPVGFGNPVRNACAFCHNMSQMGNDVAPGQVDLGTTTLPFADPQPHLPLFRITCTGKPHPFYGRAILTHDPGFALTSGKCADVGRITLQSNRGLAARAPYFSNGSAKDLRGVIDYYDRRYAIGYTEQEKVDLVNLMRAL